jgi:rare lipoprotein A
MSGSSSHALRGDVPTPEGRPYTLGNTSADVASVNATSEMSSARSRRSDGRALENPRAVSYVADKDYASTVRRIDAYAPADRRGPSELLAGRGLY